MQLAVRRCSGRIILAVSACAILTRTGQTQATSAELVTAMRSFDGTDSRTLMEQALLMDTHHDPFEKRGWL